MTKAKFDPFKDLILDDYEQSIEDDLAAGRYVSIKDQDQEMKMLQEAADNMLKELKKNKNINIRLQEGTIRKLKTKAAKLGLKYQTLIGSILHQYANS